MTVQGRRAFSAKGTTGPNGVGVTVLGRTATLFNRHRTVAGLSLFERIFALVQAEF